MLMNHKLHIDRREAEVNMNCLLFNNTSYYIRYKKSHSIDPEANHVRSTILDVVWFVT